MIFVSSVAKGPYGGACAGGMFSARLITDKRRSIGKQGGWQQDKKKAMKYTVRGYAFSAD